MLPRSDMLQQAERAAINGTRTLARRIARRPTYTSSCPSPRRALSPGPNSSPIAWQTADQRPDTSLHAAVPAYEYLPLRLSHSWVPDDTGILGTWWCAVVCSGGECLPPPSGLWSPDFQIRKSVARIGSSPTISRGWTGADSGARTATRGEEEGPTTNALDSEWASGEEEEGKIRWVDVLCWTLE